MTTKTTKSRFALLAAIVSLSFGGSQALLAQGVSINGTGARADTSAMLDVSSTTKGALIPRMSTTQRNAIVQPANGLLIWNTTTDCINQYVNNYWKQSCGECDFTPAVPSFTPATPSLGNTMTLQASTVAGATYFWTGPGGFTSSSQDPVLSNLTLTSGGVYTVTTNINGCSSAPVSLTVPTPAYSPITTSFSYTGAQQSWVLPAGATGIVFDLKGSKGGTYNCTAGQGGRVQGTKNISAGATLYLYIGGYVNDWNAGYNGGGNSSRSGNWGWGAGGGGATDIRVGGTAYANRIAVAGGGGGGGFNWNWGCGTGGDGGGLTGQDGGQPNSWRGSGGSQTAGGWGWNASGSLGDGGSSWEGGGAGGGGYYGGGGGGWSGAGGGGSNYADPASTSVTHSRGGNNDYGSISITTY